MVDGSSQAPAEQIAAVREVLDEVGAADVPELIVVNKSDVADPEVLADIRRSHRHVVAVSALTGEGIDELLKALEDDLPRPAVEVDVVVGYDRADLVAQVHREAEIIEIAHLDEGTRVHARVHPQLAEQLLASSASEAP